MIVDKDLIVEIDEWKDINEQIKVLFSNPANYPDAVLAINGEIYASTAMQIAKDNGLKIPEDISIITFTDGLISKYSSPQLTTLVQHGYEMGKQAAELLISRIENKEDDMVFQRKVLSTNIKIRQSTR